jgi:hypothetical protein
MRDNLWIATNLERTRPADRRARRPNCPAQFGSRWTVTVTSSAVHNCVAYTTRPDLTHTLTMDGPLEACRDRTQRSIERSVHEGNVRYERDENYPPSRQHYRSTNQHGRHEERTEIFHPSKRRQTSEGHRRDHQRHGDFHDHRREIEPRPPNHRTGQPYRELHHGRSLQHKTSSSCRPSDIKGDRHKRYYVKEVPKDERLPDIVGPDPRGDDPNRRVTRKATNRVAGRNTESFDPASTLVRPELRILVGSPQMDVYNKPLKHDDVVIVPELFGAQENWDMYYNLVEEMTAKQEWVSWHEGLHLIVKKPEQSPLFNNIVDRLCTYFKIRKQSIGYRFNWYKDSSDWKAFHHDSA